ncbi:MAG: DUF1311 domain-containing protein [Bdellovibrionaceae bacterium]|nr:DUF1311 domain-containing protein [Pseudobdellovibrionaceae bacterium]
MLKSRSNALIATVLIIFTVLATATRAKAADCDSMLEIRDCLALELDRAETDIAALMRKTEQAGETKLVRSMQSSQQAWLKFRDSQCGLEALADDNELATQSCLTRMTEERVVSLRAVTPLTTTKNAAHNAR